MESWSICLLVTDRCHSASCSQASSTLQQESELPSFLHTISYLMYTPHLAFTFICGWIFGRLPPFDRCELCFCGCGCAKISQRCYYFCGPRVYLFLHILALVRNISLYTITPHVKEKAKKHISDSNFFCLFIHALIYSLIPNISPASPMCKALGQMLLDFDRDQYSRWLLCVEKLQ